MERSEKKQESRFNCQNVIGDLGKNKFNRIVKANEAWKHDVIEEEVYTSLKENFEERPGGTGCTVFESS